MQASKPQESSFLNPYTAVKEFSLKPGMSVSDFGSGSGHFALAIAREVTSSGAVHAIDIRPTVLEALKGHAELDGFFQLKVVLGNLEKEGGSTMENQSQDRVLCSNILHQVQDPVVVYQEARRILKQTGKLIVLDWFKDAPFGPRIKISQKKVVDLAQETGFVLERQFDAGAYHYGLIFIVKT